MCIYTHPPMCKDLKLQPSSTTFYRCHKDALARFSLALCKLALCQLKLEVHQQVTFSNIRPLSKWKYAAAQFKSDQQPRTLTFSSPPYLQPKPYTEKALKANLSDSPIFAKHFSPSAKEHEMTCQTPSHTFHLFFIIPLSVLSPSCCHSLSYSSPVLLNFSLLNPIP